MPTKQFDDVLPTFGYAEETRETAMQKVHCWFAAALAALFIGYLGGVISRPTPLEAVPSMPSKLPALEKTAMPVICWHPGLERAASLFAGRTLAETAATLGIAGATAKTHLEHIFLKTGVTRQAELMRLWTGLICPTRSNM
jgi:hypothetical protein